MGSLLEIGPRALDLDGVADFIAWGFTTGTRTLLQDVERVVPTLELPEPRGANDRADHLWELLTDATRPARPRTWCALSGGLDSRAIAAASGATVATFGEADAADLPVATRVAEALGRDHVVSVLPADAALVHEDRVFAASGGLGGADAAPGAATDALWGADCDVLLSGMSGDVVWGDTALGGRTPDSRLRKLGVRRAVGDPRTAVPDPPAWTSPSGREAWLNLWTRQAHVTWNGVLSRLPFTEVVPVAWTPAVLSFCLTLDADERRDRALLQSMLARHAPELSGIAPVRGTTYDLDRAMTSPTWRTELEAMARDRQAWRALGLAPRGVARLLRLQADGKRRRAALVSRLRVLRRWAQLQGGWS